MRFRDPTFWYHIVYAAEYSNSTAADRIKIYVNGSRIDLNITDDIENTDGECNGIPRGNIQVGGSNWKF